MKIQALEAELKRGESLDDWLDALARCFDEAGLYFGHGTDNAADEAFWLLSHLLGWPDAPNTAKPDSACIPKLLELCRRRIDERMPMAYLLGEAWFAGMRFKVSGRVLVPRSPLAELIEQRFEPWCGIRSGDRLLEIGTGSGCIAIAIACHCPNVQVDATDTDREALAIARENVALHAVADRVRLLEADLFPSGKADYRVIISNPPYVPESQIESLPAEYAHEPRHAFDGGADGLEPTRRILAGARQRLTSDGVLIVELGESAEALMETYPELPAIWVEFERGGSGVFVLTADDLQSAGF